MRRVGASLIISTLAIAAGLTAAPWLTATASAQGRSFCNSVEEFSYPGAFRRNSNLSGLLADMMGMSAASVDMRRLNSNYAVVEHVIQSPNWADLGDISRSENLDEAFARMARGDLVIAASVLNDGRPGQAALLMGSQRHGSSLWPNGVPAGVYYHPTNSRRTFAGCKLSYVWRSPRNLKLFSFSPEPRGANQSEARQENAAESTQNVVSRPQPARRRQSRAPAPDPLAPERFKDDPVYQADVILRDLKLQNGQATDSVEFNQCVYMHGPKGWVSEWPNLRESDRVDLAAFLSNVPVKKLQADSGAGAEDAQFIVGPLCDCRTYGEVQRQVSQHNFDLHGILREDNHKLTACLGRTSE